MRINKKKAERLISRGDKLFKKGKFGRALKKFKKAKLCDPERVDIFDRLINAHKNATIDWKEDDMADSVGWLMEKQELENPALKMVHAQLSPEWNDIAGKIKELITCDNEESESVIVEEIRAFGTSAIYPLIHTLLQIKKDSQSPPLKKGG